MKNKMKTILLVLALILLFAIIFGLYFTLFYKDKNSNEITFNNPSNLVKSYVTSLIKEDYARAYKHINLPYNSFVNKNDYIKYISNKDYFKELKKYNKIKDIEEESALSYIVTVQDKDNNIIKLDVNLIERTVNDYRIDESDMYVEKFKLTVPKNTKVTIDGMVASEEVLGKGDKLNDIYILPTIAKNKKKVTLENKLGNKEIELDITDESKEETLKIELTDNDLKNKAYDYIMHTWNDMYADYEENKDVSEIEKYFDEGVSESKIKVYYETGFSKIQTTGTSNSDFRDFDIVDMRDNPNEKNYIDSDEVITLNFGYELSWNWYNRKIFLNEDHMTRYSSVKLKIVDDSFVFYDIIDSGLFTYASPYTRDY